MSTDTRTSAARYIDTARHIVAIERVRQRDGTYLARLTLANAYAARTTVDVPARALESYITCRREVLDRGGVMLTIAHCESFTGRQQRAAWQYVIDRAVARGSAVRDA